MAGAWVFLPSLRGVIGALGQKSQALSRWGAGTHVTAKAPSQARTLGRDARTGGKLAGELGNKRAHGWVGIPTGEFPRFGFRSSVPGTAYAPVHPTMGVGGCTVRSRLMRMTPPLLLSILGQCGALESGATGPWYALSTPSAADDAAIPLPFVAANPRGRGGFCFTPVVRPSDSRTP
jgi:hypothetical protein